MKKAAKAETRTLKTGISNKSKAGFTLAEIAIVVLIISIFAAFAVPRIGNMGDLKLNKNARKVAHAITYLYAQASSNQKMLRFNIDLETGKYYASALNSEGLFEPVQFTFFSKGKLSEGIRVVSFTTLFSGEFAGEEAYLHLMPEGFAERAVIVIGDIKGRTLSLVVEPLTGRVRIVKEIPQADEEQAA